MYLTDPLDVVGEEPVDGLEGHAAVGVREQLCSYHLSNKKKTSFNANVFFTTKEGVSKLTFLV